MIIVITMHILNILCMHVSTYIYIYIYIYIYVYIYVYTYIYIYIEREREIYTYIHITRPAANLRNKIMDVRGFDSSISFIIRYEIPHALRVFPGSLESRNLSRGDLSREIGGSGATYVESRA